MDIDTETTGAEVTFTPEEQAYIDSRGEADKPEAGEETAEVKPSEPSSEADQTAAGPDDDKKNSMVPHAALHEQRERRKAAENRARQLEIENARFKERFAIIDRLNEGQKAEAKTTPNATEDLFGAVDHTVKSVESIVQRLDQQETERRELAKQSQLVGAYREDASRFEKDTPDFRDAYNYLLTTRISELQAFGYDDSAIRQTLESEEIQIAQMAFQRGTSPAETIYKLAQGRGYSKKPPATDEAKKEAAAKLDTIERGQAQHKSLSPTGGSQGDVDMTAERLIALPLNEFEEWCNKNPAKAKRLMGA